MENKIIAKNGTDNVESTDFFTGQKFKTSKGIEYFFRGMAVSEATAKKQGFIFDKSFVLPANINSRVLLSSYLLDGIGLKRTDPGYVDAYRSLGDGLPTGENIYSKPEHS